MRERDDDAVAGPDEPRELLLGLGEPARGDRGLLRLERERLARRQRVELAGALQVEVVAPELLEPDALHLAELPHEIGRAVEDGHEILGDAREPHLLLRAAGCRRVERVEPALGRRVDDRVVDRVQRALRERRERAHLLDLVAEELDADRLAAGRREDVDQAAAHRELPAVVDALDALVARERERLRQALDARLRADRDADRLGPLVARRDPLGERRARRPTRARPRRARRARVPARRRGAAAG